MACRTRTHSTGSPSWPGRGTGWTRRRRRWPRARRPWPRSSDWPARITPTSSSTPASWPPCTWKAATWTRPRPTTGARQGPTRIPGPDHLDRLEAGEGLARTLTRQGDRVQAAAILEDIVARERRTLRPAHPVLVRGIGAQAEVLRDLGETDRARQLYAEALEQVAVVDPLTRGDKVALLHGWAELERQAGNRTVENELRASARSVPALQDD
ncbi:MAG: tetratricopeptide repeat protein [bacterium]|nr:tetratricopeptide repeat protein [bacterium]